MPRSSQKLAPRAADRTQAFAIHMGNILRIGFLVALCALAFTTGVHAHPLPPGGPAGVKRAYLSVNGVYLLTSVGMAALIVGAALLSKTSNTSGEGISVSGTAGSAGK